VEPEPEGINWGRFLAALRRYRWLMLSVILTGSAIGVVIAKTFITPMYSAKASVWVESPASRAAPNGPIQPVELLRGAGWIELLRTEVTYEPVVLRLKLYLQHQPEDSALFQNFEVSERFLTGSFKVALTADRQRWTLTQGVQTLASGNLGDSVGTALGWRWAPPAAAFGPRREFVFTVQSPRAMVMKLMDGVKASIPDEGNVMTVTLDWPDRGLTPSVLNAVTQEFVDVAADLKRRKLTEIRVTLDSQVAAARRNLNDAEGRYKNYQVGHITDPHMPTPTATGPGGAGPTEAYFQQKVQIERIRQDREQLEAVLERLKRGDITVDAFQTIPSVQSAVQLKGALSDLNTRQAELRALRQRYTDEHPLVKNLQSAIDELQTRTIPDLAQAFIDQLKYQEQDLGQRMTVKGQELQTAPAVTITETALQREWSQADEIYRTLQMRQTEAKISEVSAIPDLRILEPAKPPAYASDNRRKQIAVMGFVASLAAAIALALLLDKLDRRFRYPEQVTGELGLSILGAIPAIRKTRTGQLPPDQAAQVVEAFRTVRLNLAHSYGAAGPVMLTVSSPGPSDGKSLVSSNLALSFAEAGYQTLLIDGDIRRGELHRMFGVDRRPGLLDFLTGQARLDDIVRSTNQRGLSLIPCGTRRHQGPELLGSTRMAELMAELKTRYNVIIVDSPPLSAGIDPFVLSTTTGHLLMVVRSGETDRQMAEAKLRLLDRLPVRVLGTVLNEINTDGVYRYYTYLYGYTSEEEPEPRHLAGATSPEPGSDEEV
jgi:capsular exopolysaccharide synthesis family protein